MSVAFLWWGAQMGLGALEVVSQITLLLVTVLLTQPRLAFAMRVHCWFNLILSTRTPLSLCVAWQWWQQLWSIHSLCLKLSVVSPQSYPLLDEKFLPVEINWNLSPFSCVARPFLLHLKSPSKLAFGEWKGDCSEYNIRRYCAQTSWIYLKETIILTGFSFAKVKGTVGYWWSSFHLTSAR